MSTRQVRGFLEFLIGHDCLDKWAEGMALHHSYGIGDIDKTLFNPTYVTNWVDHSFCWYDTVQGRGHWSSLHTKWREYARLNKLI